MFYRQKFVTNSSSTSFYGFGISLEGDEIKVLKNVLEFYSKKYPKEFLNSAQRCLDGIDGPVDNYDDHIAALDYDGLITDLDEEGLVEEVLEDFFYDTEEVTGIEMISHPDADIIYLYLGMPALTLDQDGTVQMENSEVLQKGYQELAEVLEHVGLTHKLPVGIVSDSWYS